MPDFLDRLGQDLRAAQQPYRLKRSHRAMRTRGRRRIAAFTLAALLLAAPAAALVGPWHPTLSRPGVDGPVATDDTPVATSARDALAVLRRPQTAEDRRGTEPLLGVVGAGNQIDRVQTDGIRLLAPGWALVPARVVKNGKSETSTQDALCLTNGTILGCSPAAQVATQGQVVTQAADGRTDLAGLVPDGVVRVRVSPTAGAPLEARVSSNFFAVSIPQTATSSPVKSPNGSSTIPGPSAPVQVDIQWLDRDGDVIGLTKSSK